ncbi:pyruvate, phosphate dikinase [Actinomadura macrotermitis]|uniref:Pyruvate, phosphate dikinase n=1 Tax=Actinomadura macrotermitis TaxID=2585200 RepID=A0A7K0BRC5_9ACTN|nr:pyruvate, phosphate dikinase [Actinomadura macrotermitis]MQY03738.1 Pyruvate, phosphate dikinase [Actinomadura macrotermitis]
MSGTRTRTTTYAHAFEDAARIPPAERAALLGGKGAGLVRMTEAGLPVPPGFVLSTAAGLAFLENGEPPPGLRAEVRAQMDRLARRLGRVFGGGPSPLLVSVRSGAAVSMPGMMDTLLNIGLVPAAAAALDARTGDSGYARRSARALAEAHAGLGLGPVSGDPYEQLFTAIDAVFSSWRTERATEYRRLHGLPDEGGTAVTVQAMVLGDLPGPGVSGTGVLFTRDPVTGEPGAVGEFLPDGQGSGLVDGTRTPGPLADLAARAPGVHADLLRHAAALEAMYADMCDIEFTVEDGTLWLLQVRPGKRTDAAAARIALDLVAEGTIDRAEAVRRAGDRTGAVASAAPGTDLGPVLCTGLPASPGIATGRVVFDADAALDMADSGETAVLVREFTEPSDIHGMAAAGAILTATGGRMSHAAVVARELGVPCVCGAAALAFEAGTVRIGGRPLAAGDVVTVDGTGGRVHGPAAAAVTTTPARTAYQERLAEWAGA